MVWSLTKRAVNRFRRNSITAGPPVLNAENVFAFLHSRMPEDSVGLATFLAHELPRWAKGVWTVRDSDFEKQLFAHVPSVLARADAQTWQQAAPAWLRLMCWHFETGNVDALHDFLCRGGLETRRHGGSMLDGEPVVHLPGWENPEIPRRLFVLSPAETAFVGLVRRARWVEDDLELVVNAGVRHLEAPEVEISASATWVGVAVDVAPANETFGHREAAWNRTLDQSHWLVRIPAGVLAGANGTGAHLEFEVNVAGRRVAGKIKAVDPESSAAMLSPKFVGGQWWTIDDQARICTTAEPERRSGPLLASWRIERDAIVADGTGPAAIAELVSARSRIPATTLTRNGHAFTARFPTTQDRWGFGATALPAADYALEIDGRRIQAHTELVAQAPCDVKAGSLVGHTFVTAPTVGLRLIKPRTPEENTMYGQRALRAEYRNLDAPVDHDVALFQCFWAEVATDSQVPIFQELRRRRPNLKAYWGVLDHSVAVPEGAIPVVAGSREWYEVLASAGWIVKNTEVGEYTRLREGQCYVQTFHGQPFKSMGASFWRDLKKWPEFRVRWESTVRRSDFWSLIVTPDPAANIWYLDNYFYAGTIIDTGLPRTDALLAATADVRRAEARSALGIRPDQTAVLHATTWREDLSGGNNTSADPGFLDVAALARELGPSHVVLQRSHHSVARSQAERMESAGVLNVTDYPEINDLILASDVAVLDYSSLRFETALANVPMVFFVPDLDEYEGNLRGFLFDFEESAPGPLIRDASHVAPLVRNPAALRDEFAGAIASFNRRFNAQHDGHAAERVVDAMIAWLDAREAKEAAE